MNDFVGNILQNTQSFRPAATSCYQEHALNGNAHLSVAMLLMSNWCRKLAAALNSPYSSPYPRCC